MNLTATQLAEMIGGKLYGDPHTDISGVGSVDEAAPGDVVLAADEGYLKKAMLGDACCVVVETGLDCAKADKCIIQVADAQAAFSKILDHFRVADTAPAVGIGAGTVVEPGVSLGKGVAIGANCYLGRDVSIGDGCVVFPNVYIGDGVRIGEGCRLYPQVVIHSRCSIGKRVTIWAGAVIGSDGFGFIDQNNGRQRLPHAGIVEIRDDVEIGANVTIDRAKTGVTRIGSGTKIDNLVHIAHNCKIGKNCVLVAQAAVAGSEKIGDNVTLAGQAGVKDHVFVDDDCLVAARAGVICDLPKGSVVSGFPARDHAQEKRILAARLRLPDILKRLKELEAEVKKLRDGKEGR